MYFRVRVCRPACQPTRTRRNRCGVDRSSLRHWPGCGQASDDVLPIDLLPDVVVDPLGKNTTVLPSFTERSSPVAIFISVRHARTGRATSREPAVTRGAVALSR